MTNIQLVNELQKSNDEAVEIMTDLISCAQKNNAKYALLLAFIESKDNEDQLFAFIDNIPVEHSELYTAGQQIKDDAWEDTVRLQNETKGEM